MAASPVRLQYLEVADLRLFRGSDVAELLDQQSARWDKEFHWDFSPSRDLIQRYIDMRNLYGYALMKHGRPIGYSFYIQEDRKALIGDLFILSEHRSELAERFLFQSIIKSAVMCPGVRRIEGQLLALSFNPEDEIIYGRGLQVFERHFMYWKDAAQPLDPRLTLPHLQYLQWSDHHLESAAHLIARAYSSHVDSRINDQYRSYSGARRFLYNTSQHPGCGLFFRRAALVANYPGSGELGGVCLASLVKDDVGHITQLCVAPHLSGQGIGYELLRRSIGTFRNHGCKGVSLTVTGVNQGAISLYERIGFRTIRKFNAFVWETS
jgi:ribosomal protein S18 acetylase RimI-like enzyme